VRARQSTHAHARTLFRAYSPAMPRSIPYGIVDPNTTQSHDRRLTSRISKSPFSPSTPPVSNRAPVSASLLHPPPSSPTPTPGPFPPLDPNPGTLTTLGAPSPGSRRLVCATGARGEEAEDESAERVARVVAGEEEAGSRGGVEYCSGGGGIRRASRSSVLRWMCAASSVA